MNNFARSALGLLISTLVAIPVIPPTARADDDDWEDRWEDYQEELEEQREDYEEHLEDRHDALEEYWEDQRELQREHSFRRGHAWYGNYGPYYNHRVVPNYSPYGANNYFGPEFAPGGYEFAPARPYRRYGYGDALGTDCHGGIYGGSLSIGPIRLFWE